MNEEKYYESKWGNMSKEERYEFSTQCENILTQFLLKYCGFKHIIPTRDSIVTMAREESIILPDLQGVHKNGQNYFIELKNKNRRMFFNDNGIDYDKAEAYLKAQETFGFRVLIVFIDDEKEWSKNPKYSNIKSWFKDEDGQCVYYGNWIDKLHQETPENPITITVGEGGRKVKCFPLKNMQKLTEIFRERQTHLNFSKGFQ
jgi:hypothetical protein